MTPEQFYADCDDDLVKMIDKLLEHWTTGATFDQLLRVQKMILIEERKRLKDGRP